MRTQGETGRAAASPLSASVSIGNVVAVSGQVAFGPGSTEIVGADVETQTRRTLENVMEALEAIGATERDILRIGVFLADRNDFSDMNAVYEEFFTRPYPARTTVFVGLLDGIKVEIDAIAVLPNDLPPT